MGNGLINNCCRKNNNKEPELLSNSKPKINNNFLYEKYITTKTGQKIIKNNFINILKKTGNILNSDFLFFIPKKIKNYIEKNPYEKNNQFNNELNTEKISFLKPIQLKNNDIIYIGEWTKEGIIHGEGKMYKPLINTYIEGFWYKGCLKYGRIITNDYIYIGNIEENKFHGKGKLIDNKGNIYEGMFSGGGRWGVGKFFFTDGCIYEGNYENDEMNGYGIFKWNNGISYKGTFDKGIFHGNGILKWENDKIYNIYNGQFKKGFFHGKGIYYWKKENEYYKGDYINNIKNGNGLYLFNNGNIYYGNWFNGKPNGKGNYETKNKIYSGQWKDGNLIEINDIISKYQSGEINENINFNLHINKENFDINNLEHINTKNIIEIN